MVSALYVIKLQVEKLSKAKYDSKDLYCLAFIDSCVRSTIVHPVRRGPLPAARAAVCRSYHLRNLIICIYLA